MEILMNTMEWHFADKGEWAPGPWQANLARQVNATRT